MSQITTHILDTAVGRPAGGVEVGLWRADGEGWECIASGKTDGDGRVQGLLADDVVLSAGCYKLVFNTGDYFAARDKSAPCFYPRVEIVFNIAGDGAHYHVPLLLSPFGYTTYRGS